jgi:hypothetical protein
VIGDEGEGDLQVVTTYDTDGAIQFWLSLELDDVPRPATTKARKALVEKTLRRWQKFGDAEIHLMPDGRPRWRATLQMLERLYCEELEATDGVEEDDDSW